MKWVLILITMGSVGTIELPSKYSCELLKSKIDTDYKFRKAIKKTVCMPVLN